MSTESWTWRIEQVIPSETAAGKRILDDVLAQLKANRWIKHDIFGVHLALEEALVNAIKHGNGSDCSKQIHVACKVSPQRFWAQIRDEGNGFDPQGVPDPTGAENLDKPSGRGILLMRSFMSRVEFNEMGNCVVMEKQRAAE